MPFKNDDYSYIHKWILHINMVYIEPQQFVHFWKASFQTYDV